MAEIVAERLFRDSTLGAGVTARIFAPERIGETSEWSCKIEVGGLPMPIETSVIGVYSFQAPGLGLKLLCPIWKSTRQIWLFWTGDRETAMCR